MKYPPLLCFLLIFAFGFEIKCQTVPNSLSIWSPRKATPAYIEPGGTLTAGVIAPGTLPSSGWQVRLISDLGKEWDCSLISASCSANNLDFGAKDGWKITFAVPASVVPELCAIRITNPAGGTDTRQDAVCVVPAGSLNSSFYGVLFPDEHVFRKEAIGADGANSMDNLTLSAQVLNIANPRFVACPGDYSTAQSRREEDWIEGNYLTAKGFFRVPTLQSTGNHEYDYWQNVGKTVPLNFTHEDYEHYFGQRSYITKIGPVAILMHEIGTNQQPVNPDSALLSRVAKNWGMVLGDTSVKYRLIIQHCFDPAMGAFTPDRQGFGDNGCDLMLGGHVHKTAISAPPGDGHSYYRLFGTAAQRYGSCEWFNLDKAEGNKWSCPQAGPKYCDSLNTVQLYSSATEKLLNLTAVYAHANDGTFTVRRNQCTITNKIRYNFYDGRIRFLMPQGFYEVSGGTLLGQYDYTSEGIVRTAVVCRVNIPARSTADGSVTISVYSSQN